MLQRGSLQYTRHKLSHSGKHICRVYIRSCHRTEGIKPSSSHPTRSRTEIMLMSARKPPFRHIFVVCRTASRVNHYRANNIPISAHEAILAMIPIPYISQNCTIPYPSAVWFSLSPKHHLHSSFPPNFLDREHHRELLQEWNNLIIYQSSPAKRSWLTKAKHIFRGLGRL